MKLDNKLVMNELSDEVKSRIIEMAWEDRTPFEAIEHNYGFSEAQVIRIMRSSMKSTTFKLWRKRVSGRKTKHIKLRSKEVTRAYCATQYKPRNPNR
ncbi:MAG: TIGR03643 family protein [Gammaproteobacteria bacterium]|nr:TIGR03643 family protein [Gammaproteobacteria bacterium]